MGRTLVMGVLNVTPDSFSDGGWFLSPEAAVAEARRMVAEGADIIDIGGESTRPGSDPTPPEEEQRRVLPVLRSLFTDPPQTADGPASISLDTRRAATARAGLELVHQLADQSPQDYEGGDTSGPLRRRAPELVINDVSGLLTEPEMPAVVAEFAAEVIIMHNRGNSKTMQSKTDYTDVVAEVIEELRDIRQRYLDAGVAAERIILDPGIGFAKTHGQNWQLIAGLDRIVAQGHRVLFGASRKGFLGPLLADEHGAPRLAEQRDVATAALSTAAASTGAWAVRVHDVGPNADAVRVAERILSAREEMSGSSE